MVESSNLGPMELVVLTFPATSVEHGARAALSAVVDRGYVTVLDLVYLAKDANGYLRQIEVGEPLEEIGLPGLDVTVHGLLSDHDLAVVAGAMPVASSALVVVYEQPWVPALAEEVILAGGEVTLHLQIRSAGHGHRFERTRGSSMIWGTRADTPGLLPLCTPAAPVAASSRDVTVPVVTRDIEQCGAARMRLEQADGPDEEFVEVRREGSGVGY
ncbi:DUF6325 family protein [Nocardia aurea]|uniref:DUF6325 family protein n=1 Tax=Nocardia aurea TaxID=2144174 RepID=UPI0033AEBDBA